MGVFDYLFQRGSSSVNFQACEWLPMSDEIRLFHLLPELSPEFCLIPGFGGSCYREDAMVLSVMIGVFLAARLRRNCSPPPAARVFLRLDFGDGLGGCAAWVTSQWRVLACPLGVRV